jgi:hypothetical protein
MKTIQPSLSELKRYAARDGGIEGFIRLNYNLRSSKHFNYYPDSDSWDIWNYIDDTQVEYKSTSEFRHEETTIMNAIRLKALYLHIDENP